MRLPGMAFMLLMGMLAVARAQSDAADINAGTPEMDTASDVSEPETLEDEAEGDGVTLEPEDIGETDPADGVEQEEANMRAVAVELEEVEDTVLLESVRYNSLLFDPQEIRQLMLSVQEYRDALERARYEKAHGTEGAVKAEAAGRPGRKLTPSIPRPPAQPKPYEVQHPQFYLGSIAFFKPRRWAIWVNNTKLTVENKTLVKGLQLRMVREEFAEFEWTPEVPMIYEGKKVKPRRGTYIWRVKESDAIRFRLYPNQSFSAFSMSVEEGKLPPIRKEVMMFSPDKVPADMLPIEAAKKTDTVANKKSRKKRK